MGFLNNTTVTVDAILTKKGRELLAQGTEAFNITKFALSDDEVDYNLWDVTHPNGSDYYGKVACHLAQERIQFDSEILVKSRSPITSLWYPFTPPVWVKKHAIFLVNFANSHPCINSI